MNTNGLEKNLEKFKVDMQHLRALNDGRPEQFLAKPNSHNWVDMFVEADRAAPYLMGHIWSVYFPVSIVTMVVLWAI
jgi:hypothetical protein